MKKINVKDFLLSNMATILFVALSILGFFASGRSADSVLSELLERIGRNTFLVLALLIPIQAGMGLNFAIVIGAMAAQISVFFVCHWGVTGIAGFLLCALMTLPLGAIFGMLVGHIFNKMKGSEMIGGIILRYFADGLYQFFFLFLIGTLIPITNRKLMISSGIGVKNTIDLLDVLKYAVDGLYKMNLLDAVEIFFFASLIVGALILFIRFKKDLRGEKAKKIYLVMGCAAVLYGLSYIPAAERLLAGCYFPLVTYSLIALLCVFNVSIMKTKLGQNMRTVGQSMHVAASSGIKVDKTRLIAMAISTVCAGWGQLIFLQNVGTFQTYGAHQQVGEFAIAALLVGGASIQKASNRQAIVGVILFHTLFIVSPFAGKNLLGSAQLGEYFRLFVAYAVIAVTLALHAWKTKKGS